MARRIDGKCGKIKKLLKGNKVLIKLKDGSEVDIGFRFCFKFSLVS